MNAWSLSFAPLVSPLVLAAIASLFRDYRPMAFFGWLGLALTPVDNDAGAVRIHGGIGPAIWNVAIDEERELAESAVAWF